MRRCQYSLVMMILWIVASGLLPCQLLSAQLGQLDFNRDIRPLLANSCFKCHGPDKVNRQAKLRLDQRQFAVASRLVGPPAIVPGNRQASAMFTRIMSADLDARMPPATFTAVHGGELSAEQTELIGRWIDEGARYDRHWSYLPPRRPELPVVRQAAWPQQPVDYFILARMEKAGIGPAQRASRRDLVRRLTLDLTGLPPSPAEVAAFLTDTSPTAYQQLVDRLLASPRLGERFAVHWLDLARYADTHGYHIDSHRDMWRWRDWVIGAFNQNMPFDQFTIEQLAGDLIPSASPDQQLATGFHRNTMLNFEGGAIAEEYLAEYVVDRVITTSAVWLGQTMECCRCHDHKYDPFSQRDFYRLFAYFNNIDERGLDGRTGNAAPLLRSPTGLEQQLEQQLARQIVDLQRRLAERERMIDADLQRWQQDVLAGREKMPGPPADVLAHWSLDLGPAEQVLDTGKQMLHGTLKGEALHVPGKFAEALLFDGAKHIEVPLAPELNKHDRFTLSCWIFPTSNEVQGILCCGETGTEARGYHLLWNQGRLQFQLINQPRISLLDVVTEPTLKLSQWYHVAVSTDGSHKAAGVKIFVNGQPLKLEIREDRLAGSVDTSQPFLIGSQGGELKMRGLMDEVRIYARQLGIAEVARLAGGNPVRELIDLPAAERSQRQRQQLRQYFLAQHDPISMQLTADLQQRRDDQQQLSRRVATTMVMRERDEPRQAFVLEGGDYLRKGDPVEPGPPRILSLASDAQPASRLGLARWLVSPQNPLTARVAVNRFWLLLMGEGLVRTPRDFGTRGAWPTHPQLLDWLAVSFQQQGWDVKQLVRSIVLSACYQQTSRVKPARLALDPDNELWSRASRLRLEAEMVRDRALVFSGLLDPHVGGPSVFPYHPPGLWKEMSFNPRDFSAQVYRQSSGQDLYRRSLYTFWKRTVPPPSLAAFGAPNRETCVVQRPRDSSPLQSLVLMNDPTYSEAARCLAERLLTGSAADDAARIDQAFQIILSRPVRPLELEVLVRLLSRQQREYRLDLDAARQLVSVGESEADPSLPADQLAAWTNLVATILMTDESLYRP